MPYRDRHSYPSRAGRAISRCGRDAAIEYWETPLHVDEEDEALFKSLRKRLGRGGSGPCSQAEMELWDDLMARREERVDSRCRPLAREIEGYSEHLGLPPLPAPLPKSSLWLDITRPCSYKSEEMRPFLVSCEEGSLDEVKRWVGGKDALGPMALRDGLDCAAMGGQVHVARYFLEEVGVSIHAHAISAACDNRSLPLFELFLQHGYGPNQQVPSSIGYFGTALWHCLDDRDGAIACLLLERGADPNAAPIMDGRRRLWSERAVVPLDRTSGLPLDTAVGKSSLEVIRKLLESGANPAYSRPLERVLWDRGADDWREVMQLVIDHGADVNARTWRGGTALFIAVRMDRWDVVAFLLERGADPRVQRMDDKKDSFAAAAEVAGVPWVESAELSGYLDSLCNSGKTAPAPDGAEKNPLVRFIVEARNAKGAA